MSEYLLSKQENETSIPASPPPRNRRKRLRAILIGSAILCVFLLGLGYFVFLLNGMPPIRLVENVNPAQVTRLYSSDGKVIHELFRYNRIWIPYEKIPQHTIDAAIATEDRAFFEHWGVNIWGIPRAMLANLRNMRIVQGSSTITMQVARNLYEKIGFERTVTRKLRETLTAIQIERTYSKREIIEMYLNVAYFGGGSYGLQSAAKTYFDKDASQLTIKESAMLIGLLKGPNWYSPIRHPERALAQRNQVMHNMTVCNFLETSIYDTLKAQPIFDNAEGGKRENVAPYFTEYVRQALNKLQDSLNVDVYEDGLQVYTTINSGHQLAMDSAIARQMPLLEERVKDHLKTWQRENEIPDSVYEEKSEVQIAFVAMDHRTGHITAMVGGRDFEESKFNRAIQARRQPGSTFKPFLYSAAVDNGYKTTDKLLNQPIVINNPDGTRWTPENFSQTFSGPTSIRDGLRMSINLIAARLILEIGPKVVVDYARRMGITTPLQPYPSLAMGSTGVIPMEMVSAFGVLANEGVRVAPVSITRIEDRLGNVIYESHPERTEVLSRASAYIMTDLLQTAINRGTGGRARYEFKFYAPAAGKTGTTNDYTDAWFIGFTPEITAGVWVGLDDPSLKMGRAGTGSESALPFWADFMKTVHDSLDLPNTQFKQPSDVVSYDICDDTGDLANTFCPTVIKGEIFNVKNFPTQSCEKHTGAGGRAKGRTQVF